MRRIAFNLIAIVSMLLCAATIACWFRSYFRCDGFAYQTQVDDRDRQWFIKLCCSRGVLLYEQSFVLNLHRPMAEMYGFQTDSIDPRTFTAAPSRGLTPCSTKVPPNRSARRPPLSVSHDAAR